MKIVVLGNGSIGRRHLRGLNALSDELGIDQLGAFDPNPERVAQAFSEVPAIQSFVSMEAAVNDADVVFFCMPTSLHMPCYDEVKNYGNFNAFFEKPLSHTIAGCEDMLEEQMRRNKGVAVGYMLHYHPVLTRVKEILQSGSLGRILSVRAEAGFYLPNWHPWESYKDFYMSRKSGGGGALLDISHEINYLQWLFGEISDVQGVVATTSDLELTSDDLAVAICRFRNGLVGQIQLDLLQFEESRHCKIIGTKGVLEFDLIANQIKRNSVDDYSWGVEKVAVNFDEIYLTEYRNVIQYFRNREGYVVSGEDAFDTMQVIEGIRRSNSYGVRVSLPLYD